MPCVGGFAHGNSHGTRTMRRRVFGSSSAELPRTRYSSAIFVFIYFLNFFLVFSSATVILVNTLIMYGCRRTGRGGQATGFSCMPAIDFASNRDRMTRPRMFLDAIRRKAFTYDIIC